MFCPDCETEYREGIERCSDCGELLVESLEPEPGEVQLVPLTEEREPGLIDMLVERLEKAGVPYVIQAGTALSLLDRVVEGEFEPELWSARIYVAAGEHEARARRIMEQVRGLRRYGIEEPVEGVEDA
jgi:hypothetical protein